MPCSWNHFKVSNLTPFTFESQYKTVFIPFWNPRPIASVIGLWRGGGLNSVISFGLSRSSAWARRIACCLVTCSLPWSFNFLYCASWLTGWGSCVNLLWAGERFVDYKVVNVRSKVHQLRCLTYALHSHVASLVFITYDSMESRITLRIKMSCTSPFLLLNFSNAKELPFQWSP